MDNRDVVLLASFDSVGEAEIMRSVLESAGIQAIVENSLMSGMFPIGTFMRVRLVVAAEDVTKAREILSAEINWKEVENQE